MSTQHTPGPWMFKTKWCDQVTSGDGCICILTDYNANGISRSIRERRANARLIAAAPDLLAALKRIADLENIHFLDDAQAVSRAAIAKVQP